MGAIDRLFGRKSRAQKAPAREEKQSATAALRGAESLWMGWADPRWTGRVYEKLAEEGYRKNVIAHRAVRILAECAASVPLRLYRGDKKLAHHPLLDLLERPNPSQGRAAFFESAYAFLNIAGNSYLEAALGPDARPAELYVLRPDRMKIVPGLGGWPKAYVYSLSGRQHSFAVDQVTGESLILQLKTFHPLDDYYGLSPLEAAAYSVDIHNGASGWNKALLDNSARPSGALVFEPKEGNASLSREQFDRLKAEMEENFQGSHNARRPLLLEGGLKWQQMAFSPADMDFINAKHVAAREIALAFGVPPMMMSIPGDNTYSNYQEANRALWRLTLLPMMDKMMSSLNRWLTPQFGDDLTLSYDQDAIPALSADRQALWQRIGQADFMTLNEKRAALGLGPLPDGDSLS
ncbi:phage portal protein [Paremcibacter congregatus]|uniref:phage portal protein n=1 Tax=Paremcibacter congregatus TaxID=2043170 RepID=UPI003A907F29